MEQFSQRVRKWTTRSSPARNHSVMLQEPIASTTLRLGICAAGIDVSSQTNPLRILLATPRLFFSRGLVVCHDQPSSSSWTFAVDLSGTRKAANSIRKAGNTQFLNSIPRLSLCIIARCHVLSCVLIVSRIHLHGLRAILFSWLDIRATRRLYRWISEVCSSS